MSQIGDAISQMDQATQQNAALVEESAAAAESLKDQAHQLVQAVAVFKLEGRASEVRATPVAAPKPAPVAKPAAPARKPAPAARAVAAAASAAPAPALAAVSDDWESF